MHSTCLISSQWILTEWRHALRSAKRAVREIFKEVCTLFWEAILSIPFQRAVPCSQKPQLSHPEVGRPHRSQRRFSMSQGSEDYVTTRCGRWIQSLMASQSLMEQTWSLFHVTRIPAVPVSELLSTNQTVWQLGPKGLVSWVKPIVSYLGEKHIQIVALLPGYESESLEGAS